MGRAFAWVAPLALGAVACSSSSSSGKPGPGVDASDESPPVAEAGSDAASGPKIEHLVVIVQENHTFDSYFGTWCKAATGSSPTCTQGASCCEAGPTLDPGTQTPVATMNDAFNAGRDPSHLQACELTEIDMGEMDGFISSTTCGDPGNFAYADTTVQAYWSLAEKGALADHYFQPIVGQSSSNDMYLARAQFVFLDNTYEPQAIGASCSINSNIKQFTDPTIGDLLDTAGVTWTWYAGGYDIMAAAVKTGGCPMTAPSDCNTGTTGFNCVYDPSDVPFAYYASVVDNPAHFKDYTAFAGDLSGGTLPAVSYIKPTDYITEHPGYGNTITAGVTFVTGALAAIAASSYAPNTLVLLTYDEGGGFFDHIKPPDTSAVDNQPYGTRVPMIAIGPLARAGTISHAVMEHSSVVKFIEQNWLGATGQLKGRDAVVNNIGSLVDPSLGVPEN